jgi:hypothetical protein
MKIIVNKMLLLCFVLLPCYLFAQKPPVPNWRYNINMAPENSNYKYIAVDDTTEVGVWKKAINEALWASGKVGIEDQIKNLDDILTMKDIEARIEEANIPIDKICDCNVYISKKETRYYLLIKATINGKSNASDDGALINCKREDFEKEKDIWEKAQKTKEAQEAKKQPKEIHPLWIKGWTMNKKSWHWGCSSVGVVGVGLGTYFSIEWNKNKTGYDNKKAGSPYEHQQFKDNYKQYRALAIGSFAVGGVALLSNWFYSTIKKDERIGFYPTPTIDLQGNFGLGMAVNIKF